MLGGENRESAAEVGAAFGWLDRQHCRLLCSGAIIPHRGPSCVSSPMGEPKVDEVLGAFERAVAQSRG